jgi:hypothetical protein
MVLMIFGTEGNSNVTVCSNAEPLPRVATNANPRQLPMNRSVTLPADGGGVRLAPVYGNAPAGIAPSLAPWLFNGGR